MRTTLVILLTLLPGLASGQTTQFQLTENYRINELYGQVVKIEPERATPYGLPPDRAALFRPSCGGLGIPNDRSAGCIQVYIEPRYDDPQRVRLVQRARVPVSLGQVLKVGEWVTLKEEIPRNTTVPRKGWTLVARGRQH